MVYFYILAAVFFLLGYMSLETRLLNVNKIFFTKKENCLKIAHLSDIHINRLKVSPAKIIRALKAENPDIVIITGDFIEKLEHIDDFLILLHSIRKNFKVFLCLGNHDFKVFKSNKTALTEFIGSIKKLNVEVLHNRSVCFEKYGKKYNIIGIEDLRAGQADVNKALMSCCTDAYMNIAISHNPDIVFEIPRGKVDYLFCGHFHGGQIWVPFDLEFKILRKDKLCKMGITHGLHKINGINLYINRGLGNVVLPLRFLSRPEVSVYYLP